MKISGGRILATLVATLGGVGASFVVVVMFGRMLGNLADPTFSPRSDEMVDVKGLVLLGLTVALFILGSLFALMPNNPQPTADPASPEPPPSRRTSPNSGAW